MAASSGQGIAMLPSFVAAHNPDLMPVLPELFTVRDIWLSVHADLLHVTRIKAVMGFLEKRILEDQGALLSAHRDRLGRRVRIQTKTATGRIRRSPKSSSSGS
jgi:hypothetical protein